MGKPFNIRIKPTNKSCCSVIRDQINDQNLQLNKAVEWCRENKRRWAAINSGLFPLIKDLHTINKCLDGVIQTRKEKE